MNDCPEFETARPDVGKRFPHFASRSPECLRGSPDCKNDCPGFVNISPVLADLPSNLEFQIGAHDQNDFASFPSRCDTVLASVQNAANLAAFKLKGWTDAETTAFRTARSAFGPAEQFRTQSIGGAKDSTTTKNADDATLYENILTIQNAADLEWPATELANAVVRGKVLLCVFPPDRGGNHTPPTPPTP